MPKPGEKVNVSLFIFVLFCLSFRSESSPCRRLPGKNKSSPLTQNSCCIVYDTVGMELSIQQIDKKNCQDMSIGYINVNDMLYFRSS